MSGALSPVEVGGHFPPKIEYPGFFGWINEKILSTLNNIFNFKYHPKIIILIFSDIEQGWGTALCPNLILKLDGNPQKSVKFPPAFKTERGPWFHINLPVHRKFGSGVCNKF